MALREPGERDGEQHCDERAAQKLAAVEPFDRGVPPGAPDGDDTTGHESRECGSDRCPTPGAPCFMVATASRQIATPPTHAAPAARRAPRLMTGTPRMLNCVGIVYFD